MLKTNKYLKRFLSTSLTFPDTIFALSSGQGVCGVAVVRVSGPHSGSALKLMTNMKELPTPRMAVLRNIINPTTRDILDKGLVLWFPGPKSFTGEDSCELHVHGGLAVVSSVLSALGSISKLKLAEPGEFTRRAFFNGKMDLTEVEGLADLLSAETEAQQKQAFLQSQGSLSSLYNKWKDTLLRSVANLEAHIDFEETEQLDENLISAVQNNILNLRNELYEHLKCGCKGELLRNGVKTVIIGEPNVGKSSLLNVLCRRPAAIVTNIEGTTRDILEVRLNIGGYPLILTDTAGLRTKTEDIIEKEGISRTMQNFEIADLVILVLAADKYLQKKKDGVSIKQYINQYIDTLGLNGLKSRDTFSKNCIVVFNKVDLVLEGFDLFDEQVNTICCTNGQGIEKLICNMTSELKMICGVPTKEHPSMNQMRHKQHLTVCLDHLQEFLDKITGNSATDVVLLTEYLRRAMKSLGYLVGHVTNEQMLDVIFKEFCIGK